VIALEPRAEPGRPRPDIIWSPAGHHRLSAGDSLYVVATRAGLGKILNTSGSVAAAAAHASEASAQEPDADQPVGSV
jgi:hypothetical protein